LLTTNPVARIRALTQYSTARKRALSIPEIREFWRVVGPGQSAEHDSIQLHALRLTFLLGGQRCEQLLRVRVEDVDLDSGTILLLDPKGKRSVAREHQLPLSAWAMAEVRWLIQRAHDVGSRFLFPSANPAITLSPASVSRLAMQIRKKMISTGTASSQFQFSDLRRTAETRLAALGISKDVRAQLQSHGLGGVQSRHYDQYEYMHEKRAALQTWEAFLNGLKEA
jgi:integrase